MSSTTDKNSTTCAATQTARDYYNSPDADRFYAQVWGGEDIHVGIYREADEPIKQASRRTVEQLAERLQAPAICVEGVCIEGRDPGAQAQCPAISADSVVLDIGSGYGGAARRLVERFGCRLTCVNVSEAEN